MGERRAIGAATIAEAFRLTVEDHPDRIAVRTLHDEVAYTWAQLRDRVDALAGGLHRLGVRRGDTVALMISNRPEFMIADLAAMTLGATPFSIYLTSAPDQVRYVIGDAAAKVAIVEEPFAPLVTGLVEHVLTPRRLARGPGLRRGAALARGRARRHPHADLHQRDDRAAEGRPDRAPQPDGGGRRGRAAGRLPGRLARDQLAPERARRRAHRAPLPPDRLRDDDHHLPRPAPDRHLPAGGQADLVLRRPARVGEAQGRRGGQARRRRAGDEAARGRARSGSSSSRPGSRSRPELQAVLDVAEPKLFAPLRAAIGLDEAEAGQRRRRADAARGARVLPRHRRPAGRDLGDERDLRRGRVQPGRADQDRHRRAARRRASSSSWPPTASCSRARRS